MSFAISPAVADFFFDNNIRIDQLIWLAANLDQPSGPLVDFLDSFEGEDGKLSELFGLPEGSLSSVAESFCTALARKKLTGFLVEAGTPTPVRFHPNGGFTSYGFGAYHSKWFYTPALDQAFLDRLTAWKKAYHEYEREALKKKKGKKAG